jgi:hypothetical protein
VGDTGEPAGAINVGSTNQLDVVLGLQVIDAIEASAQTIIGSRDEGVEETCNKSESGRVDDRPAVRHKDAINVGSTIQLDVVDCRTEEGVHRQTCQRT